MRDSRGSAPTAPAATPAPNRTPPRPCPGTVRSAPDPPRGKAARADRDHAGSGAAAGPGRGRPAAATSRAPPVSVRAAPGTWPSSCRERESEASAERFARISSRSAGDPLRIVRNHADRERNPALLAVAAQVLDHGQRQAPMVRDRRSMQCRARPGIPTSRCAGMGKEKDAADEIRPIVGRRAQRPALKSHAPAQERRIRYRHQALAAILRDPYPAH